MKIKFNEISLKQMHPGFNGQIFHTNYMTISKIFIKAGSKLPSHRHPNEQVSTILEGEFEFNIDNVPQIFSKDECAVIPKNVAHSGKAITDCVFLEVFSPVRDDLK